MKLLDEEDLPVTSEEILTAATMWLGPEKGANVAEGIVDSVSDYVAFREQKRAELFGRGQFAEVLGVGCYNIPNELLAFISVLSEDAATRVEVLLVKRWSRLRDQYIREAWARVSPQGGPFLLPPPGIFGEAEARLRVDVAQWRLLITSARQHG